MKCSKTRILRVIYRKPAKNKTDRCINFPTAGGLTLRIKIEIIENALNAFVSSNPLRPIVVEKADGSWSSKVVTPQSPNFIEQTAHCDHKPRAAWVHVRLLLRWKLEGPLRAQKTNKSPPGAFLAAAAFFLPCSIPNEQNPRSRPWLVKSSCYTPNFTKTEPRKYNNTAHSSWSAYGSL